MLCVILKLFTGKVLSFPFHTNTPGFYWGFAPFKKAPFKDLPFGESRHDKYLSFLVIKEYFLIDRQRSRQESARKLFDVQEVSIYHFLDKFESRCQRTKIKTPLLITASAYLC